MSAAIVPAVTPDETRRLQRLARKADLAIAERDQAMLAASTAGASLREIGNLVGMGASSVKNIVERAVSRPVVVNQTRVMSGKTRYQFGGHLPPGKVAILSNAVDGGRVIQWRLANDTGLPVNMDTVPPHFDDKWGLKLIVVDGD